MVNAWHLWFVRFLLAAWCGCGLAGTALTRPANIILILTDDQGWSQTGFAADPDLPETRSAYLETPNLDRLAREGMRFTSGYAPAPLCTPTRRSILCGASAARSGGEFRSAWIPARHLTIPRALKRADPAYRCAHFGKWGEQMISTPEECGYDASDGLTGNNTGGMPATLGVTGGHDAGPDHFIDNNDAKRTGSVTTRSIDFLREQDRAGRPFYVQVSYYAVHLSVVCAEATREKYRAKGIPDRGYSHAWAAMLEELDAGVGRILEALDELGIADHTYVFFTADNGARGTIPGGDPSLLPTNHPLTGAKHSLYEGGIRVPFLARGPGIAPGSICRTPVVGYDYLPTFYELAGGSGGKAALADTVDGVSIRPALLDPSVADLGRAGNALVFHRPQRRVSALRQGDHKLILFWLPNGGVQRRELFNLARSPVEEGRDLASTEPERADSLQQTLLAFLRTVAAEKPAPPPRRPGSASPSRDTDQG